MAEGQQLAYEFSDRWWSKEGRGRTRYEKMDWKGEKFRAQSARNFFAAALPLFQFDPQLIGGTCLFLSPPLGHTCCDHNESESYRPTVICSLGKQTDSLVFTEFQSDHME